MRWPLVVIVSAVLVMGISTSMGCKETTQRVEFTATVVSMEKGPASFPSGVTYWEISFDPPQLAGGKTMKFDLDAATKLNVGDKVHLVCVRRDISSNGRYWGSWWIESADRE